VIGPSDEEMRIRKGSLTESVLGELEKVEKGVRGAGRRKRRKDGGEWGQVLNRAPSSSEYRDQG
jgi:hypothetical protein